MKVLSYFLILVFLIGTCGCMNGGAPEEPPVEERDTVETAPPETEDPPEGDAPEEDAPSEDAPAEDDSPEEEEVPEAPEEPEEDLCGNFVCDEGEEDECPEDCPIEDKGHETLDGLIEDLERVDTAFQAALSEIGIAIENKSYSESDESVEEASNLLIEKNELLQRACDYAFEYDIEDYNGHDFCNELKSYEKIVGNFSNCTNEGIFLISVADYYIDSYVEANWSLDIDDLLIEGCYTVISKFENLSKSCPLTAEEFYAYYDHVEQTETSLKDICPKFRKNKKYIALVIDEVELLNNMNVEGDWYKVNDSRYHQFLLLEGVEIWNIDDKPHALSEFDFVLFDFDGEYYFPINYYFEVDTPFEDTEVVLQPMTKISGNYYFLVPSGTSLADYVFVFNPDGDERIDNIYYRLY